MILGIDVSTYLEELAHGARYYDGDVEIDKNGNLIIDEKVKDHYGNVKNADENTKGIFDIDNATDTFMKLKDFCDAKGVKVFNATRGGKLEVYPRVDFDSLFGE